MPCAGIVGMRGSMVIRLRPCMSTSTPPFPYRWKHWLLIVDCWLLIIDCWLLIVDCWLLIVDCWYWLLIIGCWLVIVDCWIVIVDCWLLIVDYWLPQVLIIDWLFIDYRLLIIDCWLLIIEYRLLIIDELISLLIFYWFYFLIIDELAKTVTGSRHCAVLPVPLPGLRSEADPPNHALRHGGTLAEAPREGFHGWETERGFPLYRRRCTIVAFSFGLVQFILVSYEVWYNIKHVMGGIFMLAPQCTRAYHVISVTVWSVFFISFYFIWHCFHVVFSCFPDNV